MSKESKGYIVECEITEEDKKKPIYQENPYEPGKYVGVLKPKQDRAQITKFNENDEYKVVFDYEKEDDFTVSEVKKQDNILTRKLMQIMMSEQVF